MGASREARANAVNLGDQEVVREPQCHLADELALAAGKFDPTNWNCPDLGRGSWDCLKLALLANEEVFLDDGVDAPIAIDNLRYAEVHPHRHQ
jgi:hypothetical protein